MYESEQSTCNESVIIGKAQFLRAQKSSDCFNAQGD